MSDDATADPPGTRTARVGDQCPAATYDEHNYVVTADLDHVQTVPASHFPSIVEYETYANERMQIIAQKKFSSDELESEAEAESDDVATPARRPEKSRRIRAQGE